MGKLLRSKMPCEDCDSSDALHEYEDNFYCFSCHTTIFKKTDKNKSLFDQLENPDVPEEGHYRLEWPKTAVYDFPPEAVKWLLEAGISVKDCKAKHIAYVKDELVGLPGTNYTLQLSNRIIIGAFVPETINCGYELAFYQARSMNPDVKAKYLTVGRKVPWFTHPICTGPTIVLVEDLLSAKKVGEYEDAVALCGTQMSDELLLTLVTTYDIIKVWLDSDKPGQKAAARIVKRLNMHARNKVINIVTEKDPKKLWKEEMEAALFGSATEN